MTVGTETEQKGMGIKRTERGRAKGCSKSKGALIDPQRSGRKITSKGAGDRELQIQMNPHQQKDCRLENNFLI
jgi:hypothetical protein